jgi:hypothetical protein
VNAVDVGLLPVFTHGLGAVACGVIAAILIVNRPLAVRLMFDNRVGFAVFIACCGLANLGAAFADYQHARWIALAVLGGFWIATLGSVLLTAGRAYLAMRRSRVDPP